MRLSASLRRSTRSRVTFGRFSISMSTQSSERWCGTMWLPGTCLASTVSNWRAFGRLRNAISHEKYRDGRAIADPRPDVVEQIERLRDLYFKPPTALSVLGQMDVCSVAPGQPISAALEYVRLHDYSQLPVYDGGAYVGILTTNAIARWLAAQLAATEGLAEAESVGNVLQFAEPHECARHAPRSITAADAIDQLCQAL